MLRFTSLPRFALSLCLFVTAAGPSEAIEIGLEAGRTFIHGETQSVAISATFGKVHNVSRNYRDFAFECGLTVNGRVGANRENAAARCLVVESFKRLDVGFGLAYAQRTDEFNGSHANFSLLARWRFSERWAISWDHMSNAGMARPNLGRDMLRVRWVFSITHG